MTDKDGVSVRTHLMAVFDQTSHMPEELETPPCPENAAYLLGYFDELSSGRQVGMGLSPVSFSDMMAWSNLKKVELEPWEVDALKRLDMLFMSVQNKTKN